MSKETRLTITAGADNDRHGKLIKRCSGGMAGWVGVLLDGDEYPCFVREKELK